MSLLLGLLVLATIAPAFVSSTLAQLSPGDLSRSHEELDGALSCLKCHGRKEEDLRERCLACHEEISWLAANSRGLHGREELGSCNSCHVEHAGRDASIVRFKEGSPERFDHARSGWPLTGKHVSTECNDCHKAEFRKSESASLSKRKNVEGSFIGLETACTACHADPHRGSLAQDCRQCHLTTTWSATPGFDHAKTRYPLTGKHTNVACEKCHQQTVATTASSSVAKRVFSPLPHVQCSDCHRDVHEGRAGPTCASCHDTKSFRRVQNVTFDHARTRYPLEGKHIQVGCEKCHGHNDGAGKRRTEAVRRLPHERCSDCHADAHGEQLVGRPDAVDCVSCHRVQGWKPSTYTVKEHAALSFSLEGRHAAVECAACHAPQSKGPALAIPVETLGSARVALVLGQPGCVSCHMDPHYGRFDAGGVRPQEQGCRGCHGFDAFRPSMLPAKDHAGLGFSLDGAHGTVTCDRCHIEILPPDPTAQPQSQAVLLSIHHEANPLLFPAEKSCEACHRSKNPHGDQFARRRDNGACGSCHNEQSFRPAGRFNHDRDTLFPLLRSHGNVACQRCHDGAPDPSGQLVVVYSPTTFDCKKCHRLKAPDLPERATRFSTAGDELPPEKERRRR